MTSSDPHRSVKRPLSGKPAVLLLLVLAPLALAAATAVEIQPYGTNVIFITMVLLLTLSGLFSGSEIALISLSRAKVEAMLERKVAGAVAVARLKKHPDRLLITILVGNNLVNIGASVLAAEWAIAAFGHAALGWVTGALTLLVLIFGEIFPKTFAQRHAEGFARFVARPLLVLEWFLFPLIWLLEKLLALALRAGLKESSNRVTALAEARAMVKIAARKGEIEDNIEEIIHNAFAFERKKVREIMTPGSQLVDIPSTASLDELENLFVTSRKSRIPVFKGHENAVIGVVNVRMLLQARKDGRKRVEETNMVPPLFVDEEMFIDDLLARFQETRQQLALVRNGERRISGVVTVENVLEELVGEMFDEKERYERLVERLIAGRWRLKGDATVYEIQKVVDENFLPEESRFKAVETLLLERLGSRAQPGDFVVIDGYRLEVERTESHSIETVLVTKEA